MPSAPATARIETAGSPPASASAIPVTAISARLCSGAARGHPGRVWSRRSPGQGWRPADRGGVGHGISLNCKQRSLLLRRARCDSTRITSADGATIVLRSIGEGPGVVILHGGGVAERDYHRLARHCRTSSAVHLYNRRGRSDSAPLDGTETVATDIGDLAAVLEHTGARSIFGHSGGGFVALQAGLQLPLDRIAVYDPGLSICGRPSFAFFDAFAKAVRAGDDARAMTVMGRGVYPDDPARKLPFGVAELQITRAFLHTPVGRRLAELLPTTPPEICRIHDHDGPAADYCRHHRGRPAGRRIPKPAVLHRELPKRWRTRSPGAGPSSSPGRRTTRPTSRGIVSSNRSRVLRRHARDGLNASGRRHESAGDSDSMSSVQAVAAPAPR